MKRIGVRELRQRASEHLRLVESGETIEVTDRGRPIALLVPIQKEMSPLEMLERQGRLSPELGDLLELGKPLRGEGDETPGEVLERMRKLER